MNSSHPFTATVSLLALTSCFSALVFGQDDRRSVPGTFQTTGSPTAVPAADLTQGVYLASIDAEKHSLGRFAGEKLLNTEGAELGTIKDFIVEPASGRARYMVVSSGGFLGGIGNSLRLVPMEAVRRGSRGNLFEVDILQAQWLQTPPISDENYVADRFDITSAHHQEMLNRFGGTRPAAVSPRAATTPSDMGHLVRASVLRGKNVWAGNQPVGEIKEIIFDLERSTAVALLNSSGEFTGTTAKYLVPLSRFNFSGPRQDPIGTVLTRADFVQARPSSEAIAASRGEPERSLEPTGRTAPDTAAPLASSAQAVRRALDADAALAGENVLVSSANGKIVLRGTVATETTRRNIENVARRALPSADIDNQIVVDRR